MTPDGWNHSIGRQKQQARMARTKNTRRGKKKPQINIQKTNQENESPEKLQNNHSSVDLEQIDQLTQQTEKLFVSSEFDQAKQICHQLLELQSDNLKALETLALCELELGHIKSARKIFLKCLNHSKPDPEPTVHLYLAQLSGSPKEALSHYTTALDLLKSKLNQLLQSKTTKENHTSDQSNDPDSANDSSLTTTVLGNGVTCNTIRWSIEESQIRRSCSRALVAMTEIYLTDLCFEASAEEKCLEYLEKASSLDPTDPEPLQTLASVRLSQSERELAKEALLLSWSLWRDKGPTRKSSTDEPEKPNHLNQHQTLKNDSEERDEMVDDGEKEEEKNLDSIDRPRELIDSKMIIEEEAIIEEEQEDQTIENILPPLESRIHWAKLAIECEMWNSAIEVLQQCEAEDDEDGEIQYLLAVAWFLLGQSRPPNPDINHADPQPYDPTLDLSVAVGDGLGRMECWLEAQESIETCFQLHKRLGEDSGIDKSILKHLDEMKAELDRAGLISIPVEEDPKLDFDENQFDDDDWADASDVEMVE